MSKCFTCKHFKQTAQLDFTVSGVCDWQSPVPLPKWLDDYVTSGDRYYGPKREVGKFAYTVWDCAAHGSADEAVIAKRQTETWYE
jgi:hypothetical protein